MREKFSKWMYGDYPAIPLADIDQPLLERLRSLAFLASCVLLGFLIMSIIFKAFLLLPIALIVALYLGWECISLYHSIQQRELSSFIGTVTEINRSAWDRHKRSQALIITNEEGRAVYVPLSYTGKPHHLYAVGDSVRVYYNAEDGIMEYDGLLRIRTMYAISLLRTDAEEIPEKV